MKKFVIHYLKNEQGVFTVWITLISIVLLSFMLLIIEITRYNSSISFCQQNVELATISAMADYEPDVFNDYSLYVLDSTYGKGVDNTDILKSKIYDYANRSINLKYQHNSEGIKDILGCVLRKISFCGVKYLSEDNKEIINQVCANIQKNAVKKNLTLLERKESCSNSIENKKRQLCTYIINYFSSYKTPYILGYMKRNKVYEVEYILKGKSKDNDNLEQVIDELNDKYVDNEASEIICTKDEYINFLYEKLMKVDMDVLCSRMIKLIISNINTTYDKNLVENKIIIAVDVEMQYEIEKRATKIQLVNQLVNYKIGNMEVKSKYKFKY